MKKKKKKTEEEANKHSSTIYFLFHVVSHRQPFTKANAVKILDDLISQYKGDHKMLDKIVAPLANFLIEGSYECEY
jgi:hypothetical protein